MPNITRGGSTGGVLAYLIGKGRSGEHVNPHLVAGRAWAMFEKGGRTLVNRKGDARDLAAFIDGPMNEALVDGRLRRPPTRAVKDEGSAKAVERAVHVWHCSLALHPEEPAVGDPKWGAIASRFMALMELEPADGGPACRWVAIHHGPAKGGGDHIHIVANVVGEDGRRWGEHNDQVRAQSAAAELEREFGLRITEGRARGAGQRGYKQGELEADKRRGRKVGEWELQEDGQQRIGSQSRSVAGSARQTLERIVRACATAAVDEPDFVARLREEGVVALARYAKGSQTEIVGYAVALRTARGEPLVPIGGGRLARDLTLPRLRAQWPEVASDVIADAWRNPSKRTRQPPGPVLAERCVSELDALRERLRDVDPRDEATWAHVARDAAGILSAWSLRTEPQPGALAAAARSLSGTATIRAARGDRRRWHGAPARHTAELLLGSRRARTSRGLVREVALLTERLGEMHAAANQAQRAFELEVAAAAQIDAVRRLEVAQSPPRARPNLDGPRGADSDLER
jgi:hypothetical protein